MYNYNITWQDTVNPTRFTKSCHIKADDLSEVAIKFSQTYPTGVVLGLVRLDN